MTLVCVPRAVRLTLWVDVQHYSSDFSPVRALAVGLQEADVRYNVLFIVRCQRWPGWS
ncbi:hypothetical protein J2R80_004404 [Bradyrhizobium sp. USDA 4541]|nr:hypothetical protein [Bradyrhizobium sp. USDA 4541]